MQPAPLLLPPPPLIIRDSKAVPARLRHLLTGPPPPGMPLHVLMPMPLHAGGQQQVR